MPLSRTSKQKLLLLIPSTLLFIPAFILNITSYQPLYNTDLNIIPSWQNNPILSSSSFLTFMNIISNLFNPVLCAGYILGFYLLSYRKMEVLGFLVWFVWLSFLLGVLKEAMKQPRPFWVDGGEVRMLEWVCYTEYGCPSGHSMMAVVLLEFIVRFFARVHRSVKKHIWLFYGLIFVLQSLVMLSRVLLGMHTFNQVLMGLTLGIYSFIPYYLYIQRWILTMLLKLSNPTTPKPKQTLPIIIPICLTIALELTLTFIPTYNNQQYWQKIKSIQKCSKVLESRSFQYRCFQDQAIVMVAFSIMAAMVFMRKPANLAKMLGYGICSGRFWGRLAITVGLALIPVIVFLNPFWHRIDLDNTTMSIILWANQTLAFFISPLILIQYSSLLNNKCGLQKYKTPTHYYEFIKHQTFTEHIQTSSACLQTELMGSTELKQGEKEEECFQ